MTPSESSGLSSPLSSVPSSPIVRSSSPLSFLSRSPSPPPELRLFTPPPSQDAGEDMPRPRKRRKIERPDRTTRYLDLTEDAAQSVYDRNDSINALLYALRKRRKIVVIAGAGISVSAGIPDFRSAQGLFAGLQKEHKLKGGSGKQLFEASVYSDATLTSQFHDMVRNLSKMSKRAKPTAFHHMLARLAQEGRLLRLYTQNIDCLDTQMPPLRTCVPLPHKGPWPQTVQLHGGLEKMSCQKCQEIMDFDPALFDGEETPTCPQCRANDEIRTNDLGRRSHGIGRLRPRIVLYNELNPDQDAIGSVSAADMKTRPDAVVVVGTSMKIPGVRTIVSEMCKIVRDRKEGTTIWINPDPEPTGSKFENCWDLIVKGGSDQVADLVKLREWDDPSMEGLDTPTEYTDSDVERINARQGEIKINLPPSPLKQIVQPATAAVMTPPRSQDGDSQEPPNSRSTGGTPFRLKLMVGAKSAEVEKTKREQNRVQVMIPAITKAKVPLNNNANGPITTKRKNPASDGKKLAEVLGKENVEKNRKTKTSRGKREHAKPLSKTEEKKSRLQQTRLAANVTKRASLQPQPLVQKDVPPNKQASWPKDEVDTRRESMKDYKSLAANPPPQFAGPFMSMGPGALGPPSFQGHKQISTPAMTSTGTTPQDTPDPQTPPGNMSEYSQMRGIKSKSSQGTSSPTLYDRRETISPKGSLPRGMENLLH